MTTTALLILVAYLAWDRWQARHVMDRAAAIIECGSPDLRDMIALCDRQAQRIQAPQLAVAEHNQAIMPPAPVPEHIPMDDDDAFWAAYMPKEQLARQFAEADLNGGG